MSNPGWSHPESPFHPGEMAIQARLGVREAMETQARRVVRDYLTQQHRLFFAQLPFLLVGSVDTQSRPWASIIVGKPGFVSSPDPQTLHIASQPLMGDSLAVGSDISLLGIELPTRRRNRLNGLITAHDHTGITLRVSQSFGNCPMYIQARTIEFATQLATPPAPDIFYTLGQAARALITAADTFFIATAYQSETAKRAQGVDVSHRGGKPGFVKIEDEGTLLIPDFVGNFHFNTLGNLLLNPKTGLLFIDFIDGDLLYLTGEAEIVWEGELLRAFVGAERLVRFRLTEGRRLTGQVFLCSSEPEYSPYLTRMGTWQI